MRKLLAIILTLVFALTLTACGASEVDKVLDEFEAWADECIQLMEQIKKDPANAELIEEFEVLASEGAELEERMEELKDTIVTEKQAEEFAERAEAVYEKIEKASEGLNQ